MKPAGIHPAAEQEIWHEVAYYESKQAGLGRDLIRRVRDALQRIRTSPSSFAVDRHHVRRCPVERFPFSIYYRDNPDLVWIVALAHHARRPNYWRSRLKD